MIAKLNRTLCLLFHYQLTTGSKWNEEICLVRNEFIFPSIDLYSKKLQNCLMNIADLELNFVIENPWDRWCLRYSLANFRRERKNIDRNYMKKAPRDYYITLWTNRNVVKPSLVYLIFHSDFHMKIERSRMLFLTIYEFR